VIRGSPSERGAVLVEFALTVVLFLIFLFALIEFSRAMFAWNTSAEATRKAARLSSICGQGTEGVIRGKVAGFVEISGHMKLEANDNWLQISAEPVGCDVSTCTHVKAGINQENPLRLELMVPTLGLSFNLPSHQVVVMRESMRSVINGADNAICQQD